MTVLSHVGDTDAPLPFVGIVGDGQLGRMLGLAALRMGMRVRFLTEQPGGSTDALGETIVGHPEDAAVLAAFLRDLDLVTVENEWAPLEPIVTAVGDTLPILPSLETLRTVRDKVVQKQAFVAAGLAVPDFRHVTQAGEAAAMAAELGFPLLVKRIEGAYDGYGNLTVHAPASLEAAVESMWGPTGVMLEAFVPFVRELAVMVVRGRDGELQHYPVCESEQRDHRCHAVVVPPPSTPEIQARAVALARRAVEVVGHVGVCGVELFELGDGTVLINEIAPRPHNSGHYTIEACATSQFENHLRAVLGWSIGEVSLRTPAAVMVNAIGTRTGRPSGAALRAALEVPGVAVHVYGKRDVRLARKMGHVTATGSDPHEVRERAERAAALLRL
jgi:5-(carboxyamino)imidazole ribonucleotide synthase